jgi:5-amino-6-(5-phosphoribosylamino)uracil reductase
LRPVDAERPYVLLSCAVSVDGYIDDATGSRLVLSNAEDADRVDEVRATCDAILVGANTIRRDDPRLLVRSADRRARRLSHGRPASPLRVTVTGTGDLDPAARFFRTPGAGRLLYCTTTAEAPTRQRLGGLATVVGAGDPIDLRLLLADLAGRGVRRLLVEGGSAVHTWFLTLNVADELQLAVAPLFVGDSRAPRFVGDGVFGWTAEHRMALAETRPVGDIALLRYLLKR